MSTEDLSKKLDAAIAKITALDSELAGYRKQSREPAPPVNPNMVDVAQFKAAFLRDPVGMVAKMGIPKDYVTQHFVADALGEQAPPHLQNLRQIAPTIEATSQLTNEVATLRQRIEASDAATAKAKTRESLKTMAADKVKYPHLSKALANDPSYFDGIDAQGDASELASKLDGDLARTAKALGIKDEAPAQTGSTESPDATQTTRQQVTAQTMGTRAGDPPPLPQGQKSTFTEDDDKALRDEIARKFASGSYGA